MPQATTGVVPCALLCNRMLRTWLDLLTHMTNSSSKKGIMTRVFCMSYKEVGLSGQGVYRGGDHAGVRGKVVYGANYRTVRIIKRSRCTEEYDSTRASSMLPVVYLLSASESELLSPCFNYLCSFCSLYYLPGLLVFAVMPRKRRSFIRRKRSNSAPATLCRVSPKRHKTHKGCPEESMTAALRGRPVDLSSCT